MGFVKTPEELDSYYAIRRATFRKRENDGRDVRLTCRNYSTAFTGASGTGRYARRADLHRRIP